MAAGGAIATPPPRIVHTRVLRSVAEGCCQLLIEFEQLQDFERSMV